MKTASNQDVVSVQNWSQYMKKAGILKIKRLTLKISPLKPPTVWRVGGCNSRRFWAIGKSKHVSDSSNTAEYYYTKKFEKSPKKKMLYQYKVVANILKMQEK